VGETLGITVQLCRSDNLSVSSNGSTWVKRFLCSTYLVSGQTFSILERIDVGETRALLRPHPHRVSFSILERIDVGETTGFSPTRSCPSKLSVSSNGSTWVKQPDATGRTPQRRAFSILERIDVGETTLSFVMGRAPPLSVSSNGSTWVKRN